MNKLILILATFMVGCANTQVIEQYKRDAQERKQLEYYDNKNTIPTAGRGPLEMPQWWLDQWRDKPIDKNQNR